MEKITFYQIVYWLGLLGVILGVFWAVHRTSKRLFAKDEPGRRRVKKWLFTLLGTPVMLIGIYAIAIFGFLGVLGVHDFVGIAYSKQFLAGDCYPIVYPSRDTPVPENGRSYFYDSEMKPEVIKAFFQDELGAVDEDNFKFSENLWLSRSTTEGNKSTYTLSCTAYYGNGFYEQSCIYVRETDLGSTIETTWNILPSEFGGWCN